MNKKYGAVVAMVICQHVGASDLSSLYNHAADVASIAIPIVAGTAGGLLCGLAGGSVAILCAWRSYADMERNKAYEQMLKEMRETFYFGFVTGSASLGLLTYMKLQSHE